MAGSSMMSMSMQRLWQLPARLPWETKRRGHARAVLVQQPVSAEYICGLCDLILRQPMQSLCGHRFCNGCVSELDSEEIPCPACQREEEDMRMDDMMLGVNTVRPDNALRRPLMKQPARCPNAGCGWSGSFEEYDTSHYAECEFQKMACPDCGAPVLVRDLEEHKAQSCSKRRVECARCDQSIPAVNMERHITQQCPKVSVQCDSCSAPPMLREKLVEHYEKFCQVPKILCPYGCEFVFIEKGNLEAHQQQCIFNHTRILNDVVIEMENRGSGQCSDASEEAVPNQLDSVNELTRTLERLEQMLAKKSTQVTSDSSIPANLLGKVNRFDEQCNEGYEKIGAMSFKLEGADNNMHTGQVIAAQAKKDNVKLVEKVERHSDSLTQVVDGLKDRLHHLEETSFNGTLLWSLHNFSSHLRKAQDQSNLSVLSPKFFSHKYGYCMRLRLYPTGEGIARGTHMSLYVELLQGEFDALLKWPFRQRVTFTIINQHKLGGAGDLVHVYEPDATSLRKPSRLNSPAHGWTHVALISRFQAASDFLNNDMLFIKCVVDTSDLNLAG